MRIVVLCPTAKRTGGPEALHQLVDSLARQNIPAAICYVGAAENTDTPAYQKPEAYRHYLGDVIGPEDVQQVDHIIFPETLVHWRITFPRNSFSIWWLSINNFNGWLTLLSRLTDMRSRLRVMKSAIERPSEFKITNSSISGATYHLVQSSYAQSFLCRKGYQPRVKFLSDYITVESTVKQDITKNHDSVLSMVTNGAKGIVFQKVFSLLAPSINLQPLKGLSPTDLRAALADSDVYIDFGHQPGKDRLPREAAVLGNVVFVRRKGAGNNSVDTPIANNFKFECTPRGLRSLKKRLEKLSAEKLASSRRLQQTYVSWISEEKVRFDTEARAVAESLVRTNCKVEQ